MLREIFGNPELACDKFERACPENTRMSYYQHVRAADGGHRNPRNSTGFFKYLIDAMNAEYTSFAIDAGPIGRSQLPPLISQFDNTPGMHFYDDIIVIEKGERLPFQRVIHQKKT